jgi:hypothetical protein
MLLEMSSTDIFPNDKIEKLQQIPIHLTKSRTNNKNNNKNDLYYFIFFSSPSKIIYDILL